MYYTLDWSAADCIIDFLSIYGAFLGAEGAKDFFNSLPGFFYWMSLTALLSSSLCCVSSTGSCPRTVADALRLYPGPDGCYVRFPCRAQTAKTTPGNRQDSHRKYINLRETFREPSYPGIWPAEQGIPFFYKANGLSNKILLSRVCPSRFFDDLQS